MISAQSKTETSTAAKRLAGIAWECYEGNYTSLRKIIEAQGGSWAAGTDGTQICHSRYGVPTVGFPAGDPVTTFVQVCFALYGDHWSILDHTCEAQQLVNRRWKDAARVARAAAKGKMVVIDEDKTS